MTFESTIEASHGRCAVPAQRSLPRPSFSHRLARWPDSGEMLLLLEVDSPSSAALPAGAQDLRTLGFASWFGDAMSVPLVEDVQIAVDRGGFEVTVGGRSWLRTSPAGPEFAEMLPDGAHGTCLLGLTWRDARGPERRPTFDRFLACLDAGTGFLGEIAVAARP